MGSKVAKIIAIVVVVLLLLGVGVFALVQNSDDESTQTTTSTTQVTTTSDVTTSTAQDSITTGRSEELSIADAERIALDRYGGTIEEIERDTHNSTPVWEIEIADSREGNIEVKIDRRSGETVSIEYE